MRFWSVLALGFLIASGSGCNFAVKHPAATAGIVVGSIGLATCSLTTGIDGDASTPGTDDIASSPRAKCYGVTAGAGIGIALLAAFALWLGYEDDPGPTAGPGGPVVDPTNLEPAPVFVPKEPPPKLEPKPEPPKPEPPKPEPAKPEPPKPEPQPDPAPQPPPDPAPAPPP